MSVRVRFAPSPTGQIHVGNARTALFNWLFARHQGGVFILRIEDTDVEREQQGAEAGILDALRWLELPWDEGPDRAGEFGPYRQSERMDHYRRAYSRLQQKGAVYPCFCSDAILEQDRIAAQREGRTPGYQGRCAALPAGEADRRAAAGEPHALRFRVGRYGIVPDLLRGDVDFRTRPVFDPIVRRRDGRPTYNFAAVVDDAAMAISHVLRGEDHLTNTALQIRVYEELELAPPLFAHFPLILNADGAPLSKRDGASSVEEIRAAGYHPEGLVNALALLGWTPPGGGALLDRSTMIAQFELEAVHTTPGIFDIAKLDWISGQKIRLMDPLARGRELGTWLRRAGLLVRESADVDDWLARLGELLATGISRFEQAPEMARPILSFDAGRARSAGALEGESAAAVLHAFVTIFAEAGVTSEETVPLLIEQAKKMTGLKGRALLHPLRVAITGEVSGPELAKLLPLVDDAARLQLSPGLPGPVERIRLVLESR